MHKKLKTEWICQHFTFEVDKMRGALLSVFVLSLSVFKGIQLTFFVSLLITFCFIFAVIKGQKIFGAPTFEWALESAAIPGCPYTLLLKYNRGRIIYKACMDDFEKDKKQYCNYLGTILGRPTNIPIAVTSSCAGRSISKDFYVRKPRCRMLY